EENARLVRAFMRLHGASHVGFVELDAATTEKMIYSYDNGGPVQGPRLDITDADQPEDNTEERYRVIPKKARWVIVYTMRMSDETIERPATELGGRSHGYMYNLKSLLQGQVQNFLRTLGYMGIGEASPYNALGAHVGFAIMAGLGEMSRLMHLITPEYGLRQRVQMMITDLPLAPGKPVDFGVMNFCRTCKKCADNCPPGAISKVTEPSWDTQGAPYASPGVKTWFWPQHECNAFIRMNNGCAICHAVCPLSKGGSKAMYHDLQRWMVANTPLFNGLITQMDGFLGYGWRNNPQEIEGWWDLDLPPWGYQE
ncbi:MAG: reductive dehalogenase, partial [Dehalococcoidia bacterium]